jgi:hypothetical protein
VRARVVERGVLVTKISVHAASEDGEQPSVITIEAVTDSTWEASKDDAEVNVGEVQVARETAGITKTNAEDTADADAEAAESATGGTVPPNEVASAEMEGVDAAPEERPRRVDVNTVQTVKAEAPKAPEEVFTAPVAPDSAAAPKAAKVASVETEGVDAAPEEQPYGDDVNMVQTVKAKAPKAPEEVFTAPVAPDCAAAPEAAKVEEEAGDPVNVLRKADQAAPEEFPKFGTHVGKKVTEATVDEEAGRLVHQAARIEVDIGTAASEEEPAVDKAKFSGATVRVEGWVEGSVKGQTVVVIAGTGGAKVGVITVVQLGGPFFST